jgi:hypothetical protein
MEIVYNSGLHIEDPSELSSLAIFYDEIFLPSSNQSSCGELVALKPNPNNSKSLIVDTISLTNFSFHKDNSTHEAGEYVSIWEQKHALLFRNGVIKRLPDSPDRLIADLYSKLNVSLDELASPILRLPFTIRSEKGDLFLWQDHFLHLLRTDIDKPSIFTSRYPDFSRELMKSLMVLPAFKFLIPKVNQLEPEQVLEIREKTKNNREGFSMYIQQLSAEVEQRIKEGDTIRDVSKYATGVVETKLIPEFKEFERQLNLEKAGRWESILDKTGKLFEIDAAPWTPKFYGELLEALGLSVLGTLKERRASMSNKTQALRFMNTIKRNA